MNNGPTRTVSFTVTPAHFPHILMPWIVQPYGKARYSIRVPADAFPAVQFRDRVPDDFLGPMVNVSSPHPPLVMPGEGTGLEYDQWNELIAQANTWKYPIDKLLLDRPVTVAGHTYENNNQHTRSTHVFLDGVKVGGDLTKDEGLGIHIIEVKGWFNAE